MKCPISNFEADVLLHTSSNGRYVTDERRVIEMADRGLLFDHGPQPLAGGMHYLVTTPKGRAALNDWKAAQPKPKPVKRRSVQFQKWRDHCEVFSPIPFPQFLKEVWPVRYASYY